QFEVPSGVAKLDLRLDMWTSGNALGGRLEYSRDLFDEVTIRRMARSFHNVLGALVADPDRPLGSMDMLSDVERHRMLVEWNATALDHPDWACVHQLMEDQAKRNPGVMAVATDVEGL